MVIKTFNRVSFYYINISGHETLYAKLPVSYCFSWVLLCSFSFGENCFTYCIVVQPCEQFCSADRYSIVKCGVLQGDLIEWVAGRVNSFGARPILAFTNSRSRPGFFGNTFALLSVDGVAPLEWQLPDLNPSRSKNLRWQ